MKIACDVLTLIENTSLASVLWYGRRAQIESIETNVLELSFSTSLWNVREVVVNESTQSA